MICVLLSWPYTALWYQSNWTRRTQPLTCPTLFNLKSGKVAGKRFKKIRYRRNCFFNQSHLNGQKIYAWKPKAYSKKTFGQKIKKYSHFQTIPTIENTLSNFISNNTYTFIELQTILHTFSRYHAILTFLESYW